MTDGGRAPRRFAGAARERLLRLGLLAAIAAGVSGGKCERQGPEFFGIVSVPGTGDISGMVTLDGEESPGVVVSLSQNDTTIDTFVTDEDVHSVPETSSKGLTLSTTTRMRLRRSGSRVARRPTAGIPFHDPQRVRSRRFTGRICAAGRGRRVAPGDTICHARPSKATTFLDVAPGLKVRDHPPEGAHVQITQRTVLSWPADGTANFDAGNRTRAAPDL